MKEKKGKMVVNSTPWFRISEYFRFHSISGITVKKEYKTLEEKTRYCPLLPVTLNYEIPEIFSHEPETIEAEMICKKMIPEPDTPLTKEILNLVKKYTTCFSKKVETNEFIISHDAIILDKMHKKIKTNEESYTRFQKKIIKEHKKGCSYGTLIKFKNKLNTYEKEKTKGSKIRQDFEDVLIGEPEDKKIVRNFVFKNPRFCRPRISIDTAEKINLNYLDDFEENLGIDEEFEGFQKYATNEEKRKYILKCARKYANLTNEFKKRRNMTKINPADKKHFVGKKNCI